MTKADTKLPAEVTISVERMIRYCYLVEMMRECKQNSSKVLPLHITRFGALVLQTAGFLYSLFDDQRDSIDLLKVWRNIDHPYKSDLQEIVNRLNPMKKELRLVRHRLAFHGTADRVKEGEGLGIFDIDSGRAGEYVAIVRDMQLLAFKMVCWFCSNTEGNDKIFHEFYRELKPKAKRK